MPVSSSAFSVDPAIMVEVQSVQDGVGEQASTGEPSAAELTTAIKPQRRLQAACNLFCGVAVVISGF